MRTMDVTAMTMACGKRRKKKKKKKQRRLISVSRHKIILRDQNFLIVNKVRLTNHLSVLLYRDNFCKKNIHKRNILLIKSLILCSLLNSG